MDVSISSRHGHLKPEAQAYIESKLPKLHHLFDGVSSVQVTVDFQNADPVVELVVHEPKHQFVTRDAHPGAVTAAFDIAMNKMEAQLRKHKERLRSHHHPELQES